MTYRTRTREGNFARSCPVKMTNSMSDPMLEDAVHGARRSPESSARKSWHRSSKGHIRLCRVVLMEGLVEYRMQLG